MDRTFIHTSWRDSHVSHRALDDAAHSPMTLARLTKLTLCMHDALKWLGQLGLPSQNADMHRPGLQKGCHSLRAHHPSLNRHYNSQTCTGSNVPSRVITACVLFASTSWRLYGGKGGQLTVCMSEKALLISSTALASKIELNACQDLL